MNWVCQIFCQHVTIQYKRSGSWWSKLNDIKQVFAYLFKMNAEGIAQSLPCYCYWTWRRKSWTVIQRRIHKLLKIIMVFHENNTIDFWRSDLMACNLLPSRQSYTLSHYLKITFVLYNHFVFIYFSFFGSIIVISFFCWGHELSVNFSVTNFVAIVILFLCRLSQYRQYTKGPVT